MQHIYFSYLFISDIYWLVCAEKYDPEQDQNEKLVIHKKTDEQKQRLKEAVGDVFILTNLEPVINAIFSEAFSR